ncbi:MAG: hypothetical protein ACRYFX_18095 [Janthinobacterium lividum]
MHWKKSAGLHLHRVTRVYLTYHEASPLLHKQLPLLRHYLLETDHTYPVHFQ